LRRVGSGRRVGVGVLLEQPGDQVVSQFAGSILTLLEGNQLVLVLGVEHQIKGSGGVPQKPLSEFFAAGFASRLRGRHDAHSTE
jgi:hypothetical protein